MFAVPKGQDLVIGESLVPAVVPLLRQLNIEEEIRSYSTYKPGATWTLNPGDVTNFHFKDVKNADTRYAYNTPRDRFDESLLKAAIRMGANHYAYRAVLERAGTDQVRLSSETIAATGGFLSSQPDLIVDASGRVRTISNLLRLPASVGDRRDTALFAHLEGVPLVVEGHVHLDRLTRGWAWRIPLPGRVSVGLVIDSDYLRQFGNNPGEQFDAVLISDPALKRWGGPLRRLTPVMKYSNYQLASHRGVGDGWALVGDAFGFVDPVFSSGLLIGLDGATALADAVLKGSQRALKRYERRVIAHLASWRRAVGYFYDGRLFTLVKVGEDARDRWLGTLLGPHLDAHFPRVFTGEGTTNRYSLGLLGFMCEHSLGDRDPTLLRIY